MQKNTETRRTVWRHPRGIYETVEVSGVDFFGEHYRYRETVYTPKQDARGIAHEDQKAPVQLRPLVSAAEEERRMARLYEAGNSIYDVSRIVGRSYGTVQKALRNLGVKMRKGRNQKWTRR